jgi:hypothetical protein
MWHLIPLARLERKAAMRKTSLLATLILCALAPSGVIAQVRGSAKPAAPPQEVNINEVFAISTPSERWTLGDPQPSGSVSFAGKSLTFEERMIAESKTGTGGTQLLFPVAWFEPYQANNPELRYVIVKYDAGKATTVIAEYQRQRFALPRDGFNPTADGKSFYKDLNFVVKGDRAFVKQAISRGEEDGKGNLWIDSVLIYSAAHTAPTPTKGPKDRKPGS